MRLGFTMDTPRIGTENNTQTEITSKTWFRNGRLETVLRIILKPILQIISNKTQVSQCISLK